jgi:integrase
MSLDVQHKGGMEAQKSLAFSDLAARFLKENKFSKTTINTYASHLRTLASRLPLGINDCLAEHIEAAVLQYKNEVATITWNLHIKTVRKFLRWLREQNLTNLRLFVNTELCVSKNPRVITVDEYEKVLATCTGYELDIFIFLCNTGLRASEFLSLRPENISGQFVRFVGKGKVGVVPLSKTVLAIIKRDPKLSFIRGKSCTWLWFIFQNISTKAQIPPIHPHSARHYFGTQMYKRTKDIVLVSKLLRHASIETTQRYIACGEESLKGTTDILD